ncbi:MAG: hypothetical protein GX032_00555 [Tenericutes bacterium]|jgi:hypothetical protein|nr:hypothetical protein [Mycoplasmatota bacterium]
MNIVVANLLDDKLNSLNVEIIKKVNGEFEANELIKMFSNFFYNKMILDITAIKNYSDLKNLQVLSSNMDMSKIIFLLDDTPQAASSLFLSKLISIGIYNFTKNKEGIEYLMNHTNTYKDVAHIHQIDNLTKEVTNKVIEKNVKVLGFKNLTSHAGATSLIYMLKKQLTLNYKVAALEVDRTDFIYYNDKDMYSTTNADLFDEIVRLSPMYDILLVDLNVSGDEGVCNDVLYLLEPSTIKLNKLIRRQGDIFDKLGGKKIVLNKSLLDTKDVSDFEYEAKTKVYYSIPPLNDRMFSRNLDSLLARLGFTKQVNKEDKQQMMGFFKS